MLVAYSCEMTNDIKCKYCNGTGQIDIPLMETCPTCHGQKYVMDSAWLEHFAKVEALQKQCDFKVFAWNALRAQEPNGPEEIPCQECEGIGKVTTEAGQEILELVSTFQTSELRAEFRRDIDRLKKRME